MVTEEPVLVTQPSLKNYAGYWLVTLACIAGAVALAAFKKPILNFFKSESPMLVGIPAVVLVAVAVVLVAIVLWKRASLALRVYDDRIVIERGILAKNMKELFITDIRTIDINQTIFQRVMGTGDMVISTPGVSQTKDVLSGFPDPAKTKDAIIRLRQKKKEEVKDKPEAAPAPTPAAPPAEAGGDQ